MKPKKPLKMFVPKNDWYEKPNQMTNDPIRYTRPEIHELVKAHAEKLGWDCGNKDAWHYESSIIELDQFGDVWFYNTNVYTIKTDIKNVKGIEILWQDFLKLTPKDVEACYPIEKASESFDAYIKQHTHQDKPSLTQEEIDILTFKQSTTTDRNEKAEKYLEIILKNNYQYAPNRIIVQRHVQDAFLYADEFLKQAGNK